MNVTSNSCSVTPGQITDLDRPKSTNPKDRIGYFKPPLHLVPPAIEIHLAQALRDGAKKYGPYNWRQEKVSASTYVAAAKRHLAAWWDGEETASDSGVHHLAHAAACLAILLDAQECDCLVDDRPPKGAAGKLLTRFTEKTPPFSPVQAARTICGHKFFRQGEYHNCDMTRGHAGDHRDGAYIWANTKELDNGREASIPFHCGADFPEMHCLVHCTRPAGHDGIHCDSSQDMSWDGAGNKTCGHRFISRGGEIVCSRPIGHEGDHTNDKAGAFWTNSGAPLPPPGPGEVICGRPLGPITDGVACDLPRGHQGPHCDRLHEISWPATAQ